MIRANLLYRNLSSVNKSASTLKLKFLKTFDTDYGNTSTGVSTPICGHKSYRLTFDYNPTT